MSRGEVLFSRDDEQLVDLIEQVGLEYIEFAYYVGDYLREVMR